MSTDSEVVLLTGASGGLGRRIALGLAGTGRRLAIAYHANEDAIRDLSRMLSQQGQEHVVIHADLTREEDVEGMVKEVTSRWGRLDALINNAGINVNQVVWKLDLRDWERVIAVNLTGPFLCMKHALRQMRSAGYGRIVNIASVVGQVGVPGTGPYAASKAGLLGVTRTVARETAGKNITVNAIALGYFSEGMISQVPEPILAEIVKGIPRGALGAPAEIVKCIEYLIGPDSSYLTGQTINLNGGLYC